MEQTTAVPVPIRQIQAADAAMVQVIGAAALMEPFQEVHASIWQGHFLTIVLSSQMMAVHARLQQRNLTVKASPSATRMETGLLIMANFCGHSNYSQAILLNIVNPIIWLITYHDWYTSAAALNIWIYMQPYTVYELPMHLSPQLRRYTDCLACSIPCYYIIHIFLYCILVHPQHGLRLCKGLFAAL